MSRGEPFLALQFGHGMGAVETPHFLSLYPARHLALQFGHGMGAVETERGPDLGLRGHSFNSATAWEPWRQSCVYLVTGRGATFNSATAWEPWRRCLSLPCVHQQNSFNSATAWEPWRHRRSRRRSAGKRPSIRPRHGSRGDPHTIGSGRRTRALQFGHGMGAVETRLS